MSGKKSRALRKLIQHPGRGRDMYVATTIGFAKKEGRGKLTKSVQPRFYTAGEARVTYQHAKRYARGMTIGQFHVRMGKAFAEKQTVREELRICVVNLAPPKPPKKAAVKAKAKAKK